MESLAQQKENKLGLDRLIGESPSFLEQIDQIPKIAECDVTVLITGNTGTGKELVARAIHYLSERASYPFVAVNCGAIPVDLIENELFGHEAGAYTNASTTRRGLIHEGNGGTLFLDEVDCLPPMAQVKLLRFLQEGEYRALGSSKIQRADIRVLAATNIDLEMAVTNKTFRQDLYYRLNVLGIRLPSLHERKIDIPLLAMHFLSVYATRFKKQILDIAPDAMQMLVDNEWPGNVRELENAIERAVVLTAHSRVEATAILLPKPGGEHSSFHQGKLQVVSRYECSYVKQVLQLHKGNLSEAAKAGKTSRRTLQRLMRKHNISVEAS